VRVQGAGWVYKASGMRTRWHIAGAPFGMWRARLGRAVRCARIHLTVSFKVHMKMLRVYAQGGSCAWAPVCTCHWRASPNESGAGPPAGTSTGTPAPAHRHQHRHIGTGRARAPAPGHRHRHLHLHLHRDRDRRRRRRRHGHRHGHGHRHRQPVTAPLQNRAHAQHATCSAQKSFAICRCD